MDKLRSSLRSQSQNDGSTRMTFWNKLYEKPRMNVSIFATRHQVSSKFLFIILISQICFPSYWIYNLIRAVFFQNLNVYLRKTCTIVLFKVLPIWSYDFFPSFWQFVDSIPKELRRCGGQEWVKPIFDTLFWCEPYSSIALFKRINCIR